MVTYKRLKSEFGFELWRCPPYGIYLVVNRMNADSTFYAHFTPYKADAFALFQDLTANCNIQKTKQSAGDRIKQQLHEATALCASVAAKD